MSESFSQTVKHALARENCGAPCCARAELAAALRGGGGISFRGFGRYVLSITSSSGSTVRHYWRLLKQFWSITGEIRVVNTSTLDAKTRYSLVLEEQHGRRLLESCGLWDETAPLNVRAVPADEILESDCCKQAFLRSAFMMLGTTDNPEQSYSLEFDAPTAEYADCLLKILQYYEIGAKSVCRKSKFVVYSKNSEHICEVLTRMGAHAARLRIEEIRVQKDVMESANRRSNCDTSNILRATGAAQKQLEDIDLLDEAIGLDNLPGTLREVALHRRENPDANLTELGESLNPPVSKSGVNARIRRISALADRIRRGETKGAQDL